MAASSEDPQSRLTVEPGTDTGKPASRPAIRATLRFSSPAPLALPRMHLVDRLGVQRRGAVADGAEDDGGQVVGAYAGQAAAELAERGADSVVDERVAHESPSRSSSSSTPWAIRNAVFASGTPQ